MQPRFRTTVERLPGLPAVQEHEDEHEHHEHEVDPDPRSRSTSTSTSTVPIVLPIDPEVGVDPEVEHHEVPVDPRGRGAPESPASVPPENHHECGSGCEHSGGVLPEDEVERGHGEKENPASG